MSSLIEQAILDAKELKEAAIKSAEQMIIEKYAEEIRGNLEQLLEQDLGLGAMPAPAMPAMPGAVTAAPPPVDPNKTSSDRDKIPNQLEYAVFDGMTVGKTKYPELNEEVEIDLTSLSEYELNPNKGPTERNLQESFNISEKFLMEMLSDLDDGSDYASDFSMQEGDEEENTIFGDDDDFSDEGNLEGLYEDDDEGLLSGNEDFLSGDDDVDKDFSDEEKAEDEDYAFSQQSDEDAEKEAEEGEDFSGIMDEEMDGFSLDELEEALMVDYNPHYKAGRDYGLGANTDEDTHTLQLSDLFDQVEELKKDNKKEKQQNESLKKQLAESAKIMLEANKQYSLMKESFQEMKGKLSEVQLMNAKLLYSNKVLSDASLNERQKNKIVESLAGAESIDNIKIVYETLQSAVEENTSRAPKSLSEAVSRRSSPILLKAQRRDDRDANPINETLQRMRILAGINK
jgi:hypothetical protein